MHTVQLLASYVCIQLVQLEEVNEPALEVRLGDWFGLRTQGLLSTAE